MLVKDHIVALIEAGKATRLGPNWPGKRCLAKTRRATLCQKPAIRGRGRLPTLRWPVDRASHGGGQGTGYCSTHEARAKAYIEKGEAIRKELKQNILECQRAGLLPYK